MRGIVLAGGTGSRLGALTKVVNKHLLPVADKPMIEWPIGVLRDNNIDDITIVSTPRGVGQLAELLGGGYTYRVQDKAGGIAQALACADDGTDSDVAVILGDNVFLPAPSISNDSAVARCFLYCSSTYNLSQFGVASFNHHDRITKITEKPSEPDSPYIVTGLYVFSSHVFKAIRRLRASHRGEFEITDVLNEYAQASVLAYTLIRDQRNNGFWGDAGTLDGMLTCTAAIMSARGA